MGPANSPGYRPNLSQPRRIATALRAEAPTAISPAVAARTGGRFSYELRNFRRLEVKCGQHEPPKRIILPQIGIGMFIQRLKPRRLSLSYNKGRTGHPTRFQLVRLGGDTSLRIRKTSGCDTIGIKIDIWIYVHNHLS